MTSPNKHSLKFEAIGTWWSIETAKSIDSKLEKRIMQRIDEFDKTYSRFRVDSLVSKIADRAGEYDFPFDAEKLVDLYRKLYEVTDGSVSPLVGGALADAGYDKQYSLIPGVIRAVPEWDEVMSWNGTHATISQAVTLDFGAAGKGYLVDIIGELLEQDGYTEYVIDASGDVKVRGVSEIIGLENPHDSESVIGTMQVVNASLCASATNRRAWGQWHHIINAHTGKPVSDVIATWVSASSTLEADGLATALFFVDPSRLQKWDFSHVRLLADGRIEHSPNFVGELFV